MPNYRRLYLPGSTIFLTWTTHHRKPLFANPDHISSFQKWVNEGHYAPDWACQYHGQTVETKRFADVAKYSGE